MASKHSSKTVILAALIGNFMIFVTKLGAALYTNSSAMFSEAIHSIVDCGNQVLLLYGIKKASRKADRDHPFGYGKELYFWSFVVAMLIFAVGAGVSLYEGFHKIMEPEEIRSIHINYIVLTVAICFEAYPWKMAYDEFNARRGKRGLVDAVIRSKDPSLFAILFEDTAAMLGLFTALIGLFIGDFFGIPEADGAASIVIGLILAATAAVLAIECKGLLIGEAADQQVIDSIENLMEKHAAVESVNEVLTMHFGPTDILLNLSIDFRDEISAGDVEQIITDFEIQIKEMHPDIKRIFIEAQSRRGHFMNSQLE
ncbi:cation diffusion facilitator family transporter [Pseudemcibacter aquimaris]|uniref:cation diffusion facilitator family transporter n=1 Tax=Pseudemcibacter aquimaris TaxID=2857064 RepID=UPI0020120E8D|nr:cation diffusion facilitator family transporter [Pseudemcibacter aquimaris]MCC3859680.1 cation diffusion facilitator family transporter [Pseudemcibacter aquimaris]WDU60075.1 cation diffusion facilitator family transporter [Pseudemcibacter aquimaris]